MEPITDQELLQSQGTEGEGAAVRELLGRHGAMVHATARRMAPADAEDVTQAVFLLLWHKAPRLTGMVSVAGWLYRATTYACRNANKVRQRRDRHEREAAMLRKEATGTDEPGIAALLDGALARLGDGYRQAVLLRYLEGLSAEEAAGRLGMTPKALSKRAERGVQKLRAMLTSKGHGVETNSLVAVMATEASSLVPETVSTGLSKLVAGGVAGGKIASLSAATGRMLTMARMRTMAMWVGTAAVMVVLGVVGAMQLMAASKPAAPAQAIQNVDQPAWLTPQALVDGWESTYGKLDTMDFSDTLRLIKSGAPSNQQGSDVVHLEKVVRGDEYYAQITRSGGGVPGPPRVLIQTFDGSNGMEYDLAVKRVTISKGPGLNGGAGLNDVTMCLLCYRLPLKIAPSQWGRTLFSNMFRNVDKQGELWPDVMVRRQLETISGEPCHVLVRERTDGAERVWLAHDKGMLPMKYEQVIRDNDGPAMRMRTLWLIEVRAIDSVKTSSGVIWYPTKATMLNGHRGADWTDTHELTVERFSPSVAADQPFSVAIPGRTTVYDVDRHLVYMTGSGGPDDVKKWIEVNPPTTKGSGPVYRIHSGGLPATLPGGTPATTGPGVTRPVQP